MLSHGLNFSIPPRKICREEILAEFEVLMGQLNHHKAKSVVDLRCLKRKLADTAYAYSGSPIDKTDFAMRNEFYENLRNLKSLEDVIITKPDKGSGVVLMDKDDYISKMSAILNDSSKFRQLGPVATNDKIATNEHHLQDRLLELVKEKQLPKNVQEAIRPCGSTRPRMYGLPKTHKAGTPLRPILAMIGSCQHKLAKWLTNVLQPVLTQYSEFCVKDSFSFVEMLRQTEMDQEDVVMCSFDIKSLFTNVPLETVIDICIGCLYESVTVIGGIRRNTMRELLVRATTDVEFSFNNIIYQQIDGVAMGSPLGPILANIFVGAMEKQLFQSTDRPTVYVRYMDDIFAVFETNRNKDGFLHSLNNLHSSLQFTVEHEVDRKLPFLDVLVERGSSKFVTSIYRKPTFTGQYIRWSSFCTKRRKLNLISCLVHRAVMICSPEKLESELDQIRSILASNGYPRTVVETIIRGKLSEEPQSSPQKETPSVILRLPYIGNVSNKFVKTIRDAVSECYQDVALRIVLSSPAILPTSRKDVLPTHMKNNVVYKFACHCNKWYVGSTTRRLKTRIAEHVPRCVRSATAIPNTSPLATADLKLKRARAAKRSSVAEHLLANPECLSNYADDRFTILGRPRNKFHLAVLEGTYIMSLFPTPKQINFLLNYFI